MILKTPAAALVKAIRAADVGEEHLHWADESGAVESATQEAFDRAHLNVQRLKAKAAALRAGRPF